MANAARPDAIAARCTARSGMFAIVLWVCASPWPSIHTGALRVCLARAAEATTIAPPPSVTRQQSSRCSGSEIQREFSTSSIVMGSRIIAFSLSVAHLRVATASSGAIRTLRAAIGDERDIEEPGFDGGDGMPNVRFEGGTANICGIAIFWSDTQVFC